MASVRECPLIKNQRSRSLAAETGSVMPMSDAETVRKAIGDDAEAQGALERILARRDAYVREVQAERDEARRERDELRGAGSHPRDTTGD